MKLPLDLMPSMTQAGSKRPAATPSAASQDGQDSGLSTGGAMAKPFSTLLHQALNGPGPSHPQMENGRNKTTDPATAKPSDKSGQGEAQPLQAETAEPNKTSTQARGDKTLETTATDTIQAQVQAQAAPSPSAALPTGPAGLLGMLQRWISQPQTSSPSADADGAQASAASPQWQATDGLAEGTAANANQTNLSVPAIPASPTESESTANSAPTLPAGTSAPGTLKADSATNLPSTANLEKTTISNQTAQLSESTPDTPSGEETIFGPRKDKHKQPEQAGAPDVTTGSADPSAASVAAQPVTALQALLTVVTMTPAPATAPAQSLPIQSAAQANTGSTSRIDASGTTANTATPLPQTATATQTQAQFSPTLPPPPHLGLETPAEGVPNGPVPGTDGIPSAVSNPEQSEAGQAQLTASDALPTTPSDTAGIPQAPEFGPGKAMSSDTQNSTLSPHVATNHPGFDSNGNGPTAANQNPLLTMPAPETKSQPNPAPAVDASASAPIPMQALLETSRHLQAMNGTVESETPSVAPTSPQASNTGKTSTSAPKLGAPSATSIGTETTASTLKPTGPATFKAGLAAAQSESEPGTDTPAMDGSINAAADATSGLTASASNAHALSAGTVGQTGGNTGTTSDIPTFIPKAHQPVDQVVEGTAYSVKNGHHELTIRLNPENLGEVRVNLVSTPGQTLSARLIASTAESHEMLQNQVHALKTSLEAQGIQVDRLSVVLAGQADNHNDTNRDHNPQQGSQQEQQSGGQSNHQFNHQHQQASNPFAQLGQQMGGGFQQKSSYTQAPNNPRWGASDESATGSGAEVQRTERPDANDNGRISVLA